MASRPSSAPHPVDQVPPFGKLTILGIQHVLAFYAGAVVNAEDGEFSKGRDLIDGVGSGRGA